MIIYRVGPDRTHKTIQTVVDALPATLSEPVAILVDADIQPQNVHVPGTIQPSADAPLWISGAYDARPVIRSDGQIAFLIEADHVHIMRFDIDAGNAPVAIEIKGSDCSINANRIHGAAIGVRHLNDTIQSRPLDVWNNIFYDCSNAAIFVSNNAGSVRIYHNTIYERADGDDTRIGIWSETSHTEIRWNLIYLDGTSRNVLAYSILDAEGAVKIDNNAIYSTGYGQMANLWTSYSSPPTRVILFPSLAEHGYDEHGISDDPLFRSITQREFDISKRSPMIGKADHRGNHVCTADYYQTARLYPYATIGAIEIADIVTADGVQRLCELLGGKTTDAPTRSAIGTQGCDSSSRFRPASVSINTGAWEQTMLYLRDVDDITVSGSSVTWTDTLLPNPTMRSLFLDNQMDSVSQYFLTTRDEMVFIARDMMQWPFDPLQHTGMSIVTSLIFERGS